MTNVLQKCLYMYKYYALKTCSVVFRFHGRIGKTGLKCGFKYPDPYVFIIFEMCHHLLFG